MYHIYAYKQTNLITVDIDFVYAARRYLTFAVASLERPLAGVWPLCLTSTKMSQVTLLQWRSHLMAASSSLAQAMALWLPGSCLKMPPLRVQELLNEHQLQLQHLVPPMTRHVGLMH